jgi:hypothetical protein
VKARPDPTFDRTSNRKTVKNAHSLVARGKEINTQKYAAGTKSLGGGQGPGQMDGSSSVGSY